ncbi:uncharacterized protein LOC144483491 [Mustelus asterias]
MFGMLGAFRYNTLRFTVVNAENVRYFEHRLNLVIESKVCSIICCNQYTNLSGLSGTRFKNRSIRLNQCFRLSSFNSGSYFSGSEISELGRTPKENMLGHHGHGAEFPREDLNALLLILIFTSDPDIDIILITESQNQGTSVNIMAEGSNRGECSTSSKRMGMDTDPNSTIPQFLTNCDDDQLFQLTKFYRDRLVQAMEGGVDGVSLTLTYERIFTGQEHGKVTELVDKGNRAYSSKLLLNLVMEKGSRARRVMWESFVRMRHGVPKLDKILKEIQELGADSFDYINIAHGLCELPTNLKDLQQKHKETLRVQTETLRVNTILIKEKVKIFQLVGRYAELTVISTVRDRTLVEHELLARGRDHEEWREKHLRKELEKIRTDQLFQSSFSQRKSKSGNSAAVSGVPGIGKTTMVQKIVYDWATGKIYPHFQFVFSFKFRDLNTINCRINLRNLILFFYPYFGNILGEFWKNPEALLFIFDGLDEFKDRVSEKKTVFRNGDLIKYKLEPSQFLSGFLVELLEKDESAQICIAMKWEIQE